VEKGKYIPNKWRRKYFLPYAANKEYFQVCPGLRSDIIFHKANLLDINSLPNNIRVDIIFCRNVFIYLSEEARAQSLNHFYSRLNDGGHLFLGYSETIDTSKDNRWAPLGKSIYRKR